jgi:hypothetical protein
MRTKQWIVCTVEIMTQNMQENIEWMGFEPSIFNYTCQCSYHWATPIPCIFCTLSVYIVYTGSNSCICKQEPQFVLDIDGSVQYKLLKTNKQKWNLHWVILVCWTNSFCYSKDISWITSFTDWVYTLIYINKYKIGLRTFFPCLSLISNLSKVNLHMIWNGQLYVALSWNCVLQ